MYFILTIFLFSFLSIYGYLLSKKNNLKLKHFLPVILVYTFIEGLRFGRGIDYNIYYGVFTDITKYNYYKPGFEPLFLLLCKFLGALEANYQWLIIICSATLITAGCNLLKLHKKVLMFSLPLFAYSCLIAETIFRFYLGFSFILFAISAMIQNKYKTAIICAICAFLIHYALLPVIFVFSLIYYYKKIILKPFYAIIIYVLLLLIWNSNMFLIITPIFNILESSSRYALYMENIEGWLTGENKQEVVLSAMTWIRILVIHLFLLYIGYHQAIKQKENYIFFYNILLIGIITYPICYKVELFNRYNSLFIFFQCIIGAYSFYYYKKSQLKPLIILAFLIYSTHIINISRNPNENETLFIWDSRGRKYLPYD